MGMMLVFVEAVGREVMAAWVAGHSSSIGFGVGEGHNGVRVEVGIEVRVAVASGMAATVILSAMCLPFSILPVIDALAPVWGEPSMMVSALR